MNNTPSDAQKEAISHIEGPMMVLAGPGAGKTYVITGRVYELIAGCGIDPTQILVVTFSRAAANEMSERFYAMSGGGMRGVTFGTFHSVFFGILKRAYHYEAKDIVKDSLKYRFIDEALKETDYEVYDKQELLESLEKEISRVKGDGIDIDNYYSASCPESVFRDVFNGYQQRLNFHRALDFDDMVRYTYDLFTKRKDILGNWQSVYRYILIDEFQDINRMQYETIKLLAKPEDNIFIVGDDDQSIYGFRGARPDIMLSFPKEYPGAKKVVLDTNYRCSEEILSAAAKLIEHNKKRYSKKIIAGNGSFEGVHIGIYSDLRSEADKICEKIRAYIKDGINASDIAVLFRTNMQMRSIASKLIEYGVPFSMKESIPNIFNSFMGRDITAYIDLALGDLSRDTFLQVMNRPARYISRKALNKDPIDFKDLRRYYMKEKQYWMIDRLSDFESDINTIKKMTPMAAICYIRKDIGYDDFLKEKAESLSQKPDDWFETLDEIEQSAAGIGSLYEWKSFVEGYDEQMSKHRQNKRNEKIEGVNLMTMHGAKGLEFDVVFIPTIVEGVSPYRKAGLAGEIEEERRMLYVAMTRAKRFLHLSYVKKRYNKNADISRFMLEIDPNIAKENKKITNTKDQIRR